MTAKEMIKAIEDMTKLPPPTFSKEQVDEAIARAKEDVKLFTFVFYYQRITHYPPIFN